MKTNKSVQPALPTSLEFKLTFTGMCIAGMATFGFVYLWDHGDAKSTDAHVAVSGQRVEAASNIAAFPAVVNVECAAAGALIGNPFGYTQVPCVAGTDGQTNATPIAPADNWQAEQRAASQEVVDSISSSRNRTTKAFEVVSRAIKCHEEMLMAELDQCVIVFGAQRQAVASLSQFASSGDIVAKFELARLIFKEQMRAGVTESWILSATDKTLPTDSEDWNARALQMLKDAAAQGLPPAVEQLERINRGEGFLVD